MEYRCLRMLINEKANCILMMKVFLSPENSFLFPARWRFSFHHHHHHHLYQRRIIEYILTVELFKYIMLRTNENSGIRDSPDVYTR